MTESLLSHALSLSDYYLTSLNNFWATLYFPLDYSTHTPNYQLFANIPWPNFLKTHFLSIHRSERIAFTQRWIGLSYKKCLFSGVEFHNRSTGGEITLR